MLHCILPEWYIVCYQKYFVVYYQECYIVYCQEYYVVNYLKCYIMYYLKCYIVYYLEYHILYYFAHFLDLLFPGSYQLFMGILPIDHSQRSPHVLDHFLEIQPKTHSETAVQNRCYQGLIKSNL